MLEKYSKLIGAASIGWGMSTGIRTANVIYALIFGLPEGVTTGTYLAQNPFLGPQLVFDTIFAAALTLLGIKLFLESNAISTRKPIQKKSEIKKEEK